MKRIYILTIAVLILSCTLSINSLSAEEGRQLVGTVSIEPPKQYAIIRNSDTGDEVLYQEGDYVNNKLKVIGFSNDSVLLEDDNSADRTKLSADSPNGEVEFAGAVELNSIEYWYSKKGSHKDEDRFNLIDIKGSKAIMEKGYEQEAPVATSSAPLANDITIAASSESPAWPSDDSSPAAVVPKAPSTTLAEAGQRDSEPLKLDYVPITTGNKPASGMVVANASLASEGWELKATTSINSLTETYWEIKRAPYGTYDKIGLRRLVADSNTDPKGVVFYLPPSYTSARLYANNNGTYLEKYDFRIYLANRGYIIYSLDYRTSYVPGSETELSFMANWGTGKYLTDIQDAIAYAKQVSNVRKVFLAGHSSGAKYVYVYAAQKWRQDLSGMIVMDGSPWEMGGVPAANNTMDINEVYRAIANGDTAADRAVFAQWSNLTPSPISYYDNYLPQFGSRFIEAIGIYEDPSKGPAYGPFAGFATVNAYLADQFQNVWGDKQYCNVENGYSTVEMQVAFATEAAISYWPLVEYSEEAYTGNWSGDTPSGVGSNYHDNLARVDIPIIVFASSEWTTALGMEFAWKALGPTLIKNTDRTYILLDGFGHLDILVGEQSQSLVFLPLYNWLEARR